MKRAALNIVRPFLFWLLYFAALRLIFLVYHSDKIADVPWSDIFRSFIFAIRLDTSMAGYILLAPLLLSIIEWKRLLHWYHVVLVVLVSIINVVDLALYEEWSTRLHFKAFQYLAHPTEVYHSSLSQPLWLLLPLIVLQAWGGIWLFKRVASLKHVPLLTQRVIAVVAAFPLLFLGIRGGIQEIPINQSAAYFSSHNIMNHTAVNSPWSLLHSYMENRNTGFTNPYAFLEPEKAQELTAALNKAATDSTLDILDTDKPNIIFLIIEGLGADIVPALGGIPNIVPHYEQMISEGLLFTDFYATGMRSDKGIIGLISGFPGLPAHGVSTQPQKFGSLPTLNKELRKLGYHSSFYYGGDLNYGNLKAYLLHHRFDNVVDYQKLPDMPGANLGAFDGEMLNYWLGELDKLPQPFYSNLFTITTHEPFTLPEGFKRSFHVDEEIQARLPKGAMKYLDAMNYSQQEWFNFYEAAKERPWFKNTLFVVVSDHSHHLPRDRYIYKPRRHQIPLLILGGALKRSMRGVTISSSGAQTDIPATLLAQLGVGHGMFPWSKDLLAGREHFAYYTFIEGFGFVKDGVSFSYDSRFEQEMHQDSTVSKQMLDEGRAYMQMVFEAYLDL